MSILKLFNKRPEPEVARIAAEPGEYGVTYTGLGMHCMGCRALVEGVLQEVEGVRAVTVDLPTQTATVVFDPARVHEATLRTKLAGIGYIPATTELVTG